MPRHGDLQQSDILSDGIPFPGADIDAAISENDWLQDHDTDVVDESPPVQNTWYEVFDADDVRLLLNSIYQVNDEAAAKDVEIKWTIDGNVYFVANTLASGTFVYVYKDHGPSIGGTAGLAVSAVIVNACYNVDKRGLRFKVEVRMTSVPGTNQVLISRAVRETLEVT